ncbi:MAG: hypothetical protein K0S65_2689, partial [Labilithrix sp.]|nr:hypothetical protein [Labilithrix sp.]
RPLGIALMVLTALAIGGGAAALTQTRSSTPTTSSATADPPTPTATMVTTEPTPSNSTTPSDPTEITLELGAHGPITKVIRPAARRVALEDGKARVTVAPFRGELPIEVEVAGKGLARGVAREGGPTTIRLSPVKTAVPGRPHSHPKSSSELQGSPYE